MIWFVIKNMMEDYVMEKKTKQKSEVSFFNSIRTKNVILIVIMVAAVVAITIAILLSSFIANMENTNQNYIYDLSVNTGERLQLMVDDAKAAGEDPSKTILNKDESYMKELIGTTGVKGIESSYTYVVSTDSNKTMLYHPVAEKIGASVENEVVKGLIEQIQSGQKPDPAVVTYMFKGVEKYAGYYVSTDQDFIVVVTADRDEIFAPVTAVFRESIIVGIILVLIASIIGMLFVNRIVNPIYKLKDIIKELTNLNFSVANDENVGRKKDEIGSMARDVYSLQEKMDKIINDIKQQSKNVLDSSSTLMGDVKSMNEHATQVEKAVDDIAQGATSQASDTQDASENVVRIGELIEKNNNEVAKLNELSNDMKESTGEAIAALKALGDVNVTTRDSVNIISEQTNNTNESVKKISEAISLITSIAEETNLLSLNASIEAARAGEAGKGFAVVASQIQKLAEQSNDSANRIEKIIESLIADSQKAVESMRDVNSNIELQDKNVDNAVNMFDKVKKSVDSSVDSINGISRLMGEIDNVRAQVVDSGSGPEARRPRSTSPVHLHQRQCRRHQEATQGWPRVDDREGW